MPRSPRDGASHDARVLRLAGADNVRDLGGLPAAGGRNTQKGRIFRGELLPSLVEEDVQILIRDVGLRSVVDLRTRGEIRHEPGSWLEHDVVWINCPFRLGRLAPVPGPGADFVAAYLGFLDGGPRPILLAARSLMDPDLHPALFHCAAGKDRTGVLSALLLDVLGVPRAVIAEDYALTSVGLARVLDRLGGIAPYRDTLTGAVAADHEPHAATMTAFLDEVDRRHGGAETWLRANGLEASLIGRFREAMLDHGADGDGETERPLTRGK